MKVRLCFVSNSSSASFVVKFESSLPRDQIENFIRKSDENVDKEWDLDIEYIIEIGKKRFSNMKEAYKKNLQSDGFIYELKQFTSMFNDWNDVPCSKFIRALSENRIEGIKLIEILKTEEEFYNINKVVEYDPKPWNYNDSEDKEKIDKLLEKNNLEYLEYLKQINQTVSDDETIKIAMYLLRR